MALTNKLTAIADAIRTKTGGSSPLSLDDMATAIGNLNTGGGNTVLEPLTMTKIKSYTPSTGVDGFSSVTPNFNLVFETFPINDQVYKLMNTIGLFDNVSTLTIKPSANQLSFSFLPSGLATVTQASAENFLSKITLNLTSWMDTSGGGKTVSLGNINNTPIKNLDLGNIIPRTITSSGDGYAFLAIFPNCYFVESISTKIKDFVSYLFTNKKLLINKNMMGTAFSNCYNLQDDELRNMMLNEGIQRRLFNSSVLSDTTTTTFANNTYYRSCEIEPFYSSDLGPAAINMSSYYQVRNGSTYRALYFPTKMFQGTGLKHFIFKPFDVNKIVDKKYVYQYTGLWMIYLDSCGYSLSVASNCLNSQYRITDATSYENLKDEPLAWTTDYNYSFYNHDSAVETLNSLPDLTRNKTSGSDNHKGIIYFKGDAGSATDGGAINTLTSAEIAVATTKGWTVTLS